MSDSDESTVLRAGLIICSIAAAGVVGPLFGGSQAWMALISICALATLTLDAASFSGMGGHILAESLPGGGHRLWRIATHEAGHLLAARQELIDVKEILVGSLACARAGLSSRGSTRFAIPEDTKLPLYELRRWSRVLQAGMVAEELLLGGSSGGDDDRRLLGRLWGLSGHDATTAQREQRLARWEALRRFRVQRQALEQQARELMEQAPRLLEPRGRDPKVEAPFR